MTKTTLEQAVFMFPNKNWDWELISCNPNISINTMRKFKNKIHWIYATINPNITIDDIFINKDLNWDFDMIIQNPNFSFDYVKKYSNFNWNWNKLTFITDFNTIDENIHFPWNWESIYKKKHPKLWFIKKYNLDIHNEHLAEKINYFDCDLDLVKYFIKYSSKVEYNYIINNKNLDIETIENILNKKPNLDFYNMSSNKNININFVKKYINYDWNWRDLTDNPSISFKDILNNKNLNWDWLSLSRNMEKVSLQDIEKYQHIIPWDNFGLSFRNDLTFDFIEKNIHFAWSWTFIYSHISEKELIKKINKREDFIWESILINKNISNDFILDNIDIISKKFILPYLFIKCKSLSIYQIEKIINDYNQEFKNYILTNIFHISSNKNINIDFIKKYHKYISFYELSENDFHYYEIERFNYEKMKKTHNFIKKIKDELLSISMMPNRWMQCMPYDDFKIINEFFYK